MTVPCRLPDGYVLHAFDRLESTNDLARRLAAEGAPGGQVVLAREQTRGRGRYGRTWTSPPGNLYASVLLRPERPLATTAQLSLVAGLALADALAALGPRDLELALKWPNDVLLRGAKTAGILLESGGADGAGPWVIVGTGVNIVSFPAGLPYPATALRREGFPPDLAPERVLEGYVVALDRWVGRWRAAGFAAIRAPWRARAAGLGAELRLRLEHADVRGRFLDLDPQGALILEGADGRRRTLAAGEVVYERGSG